MKKKLIAGMTSAAVIASLSAPAFAANFTDVQGTKFEAASALLKALGVVNGDVNGNFNPNSTITRAEFAKIAVLVAGYQDAANAYGTNVTPFSSDVKAGHWAAGYIQIAKDTGLVNGYDQWNFGPSDNVKYEEVLAVLQRILGYNDNLPGNWPTDYVTNGTQLGLTKDTTFRIGTAATRGDVALMAQAALNQYTVNYSKDNNAFTYAKDANGASVSLLSKGFGSQVKTFVLAETTKTPGGQDVKDGKIRLGAPTYVSGAVYSTSESDYDLSTDATFAGNVDALVGHQVKVVLDSDNKVVYVGDGSNTVVTGTVATTEAINDGTITLDGDTSATTLGAGVVYYYNGQKVSSIGSSVGTDASVTLVKNGSNGAVVAVFVDKWDISHALVDSVQVGTNSTTLYYKDFANGQQVFGITISSDAKVTRNGESVAASSLVKGDAVFINKLLTDTSKAAVVSAFNNTVSGKLESKYTSSVDGTSKITVNGTEYTVDTTMVTLSNFATGSDVTLLLDGKNKVKKITVVSGATNEIVGYLTKVQKDLLKGNTDGTFSNFTRYTFFTTDGQTVVKDQPVADWNYQSGTAHQLSQDNFYDVTFNNDGTLTVDNGNLQVDDYGDIQQETDTVAAVDTTNKTLTVAGNVYQVTGSTVFIDASKKTADGKFVVPAVTSLDKISKDAKVTVVADANGVAAKYVIARTTGTATGTGLPTVNGVLQNLYTSTDVDGNSVTNVVLNVKGTNQTFALKNTTVTPANVGDLVYLYDGLEDGSYDVAKNIYAATSADVNTVSGFTYNDAASTITTTGGTTYVIDANTTVYIVKESDKSVSFGNYYDVKAERVAGRAVWVSEGVAYNGTTNHADAIMIRK